MRTPAVAVALLSTAVAAAPVHIQKMRPENSTVDRYVAAAAPAGAHLNYYGGPILANVDIIPVFWGPNVPSDVTSQIGDFYASITDSGYFDWMAEYDTNIVAFGGQQGTNQHLGRGTAEKAITISPSITATSITDAQIQTELQSQISAGHLPAAGSNSLYMIHFPAGMKISMPDGQGGTASSCTQFCAYHTTIQASPQNIYYGVIPNVTTDGCELGCGPVGGGFGNTTSVSSHEMIEATTDAAVGLATDYAPPLGWYDPQGQDGEIGDICNGQQGTVQSHGKTWTVQQEWSNSYNACITEGQANDFALSLSPANQNIAAGASASYTLSARALNGSPGSISLSASGLPTGFTAQLSQSSVSPGSSVTVTISVDTSAANGATNFNITGSAGGLNHTATASATVSGGSGTGGGGGGGCPAGTIDLGGGICLPIGCSTSGNGATWLAAMAAGLFLVFRKRSQKA